MLRGLSLTQRSCDPDRAARPCRLLDHLVGAGEQRRRHFERNSRNWTYGISRQGRGSPPLDARRPDHLAPLLGKFDNEFAELGGRTYKWFCAQFDEPRFECGISKSGINLLIEDRDDLRRRIRGGCNAIP